MTVAANNAYSQGYQLAADRDALIQQAKDSNVWCIDFVGGKCLAP